MNAGAFDRKITLQRKSEADTGYSTETVTWYPIATVSAQLLPVTRLVMEKMLAGELGSTGIVLFQIRRDSAWSDLNANDRLLFEGRVHDIAFVRHEGRGFMNIDALARGDG